MTSKLKGNNSSVRRRQGATDSSSKSNGSASTGIPTMRGGRDRWAQLGESGSPTGEGGGAEGHVAIVPAPRPTLLSRLTSWQCAALTAIAMAFISATLLSSFSRSVSELAGRAAGGVISGSVSASKTPFPSPSSLAARDKDDDGGAAASTPSSSSAATAFSSAASTASSSVSPAGTRSPSAAATNNTTSSMSVLTKLPTIPTAWKLEASYPHDSGAFTQGFQWWRGVLYEGTGMNGESVLRKVGLASTESGGYSVQSQVALPGQYFGEGICLWTDVNGAYGQAGRDVVFQLTWQNREGFVYDAATLQQLRSFRFSTERNEGWGITFDGSHLIVSDGSAYLHYWDPATLAEVKRVQVTHANGQPQTMLNELEFIHGYVFANVWQSNVIVIIDGGSGRIVWQWDMGALSSRVRNARRDVLNGIAYTKHRGVPQPAHDNDADSGYEPWGGSLWVTGKRWDTIFELSLSDLQPPSDASVRRRRAKARKKAGNS